MNASSNPAPSDPEGNILSPRAPHDDLGFERLSNEYNLLNVSSYARVLVNLIVEELRNRNAQGGPCRVLDIGCGKGVAREPAYQWAIRDNLASGEFWGLEPDQGVESAPGLFDQFQHALMETAELPENHFDIAYSSMVMEHVADPTSFLEALGRCLKPGGVYMFATPNSRSIVPWGIKLLHQIKADELVLRLIRRKQEIEEYHYPVQYKFNSPRCIADYARQHGFNEPEFAFIEGVGVYSYLRGPFVVCKPLLLAKRKLIRRRDRLVTLLCKMTKSSS